MHPMAVFISGGTDGKDVDALSGPVYRMSQL
jgi:hypothetical protein